MTQISAVHAESLSVHSLGLDFASYPFLKWEGRDLSAPSLKLGLQESRRGSIFEVGGEAGFQGTFHSNGTSAIFFEIPQAYFGTSDDLSPLRLKLGRKLQHWSSLDESWKMGIWQPRFRWDDFGPQQVGLVGAFFSVHLPSFEFMVLGSPAFIPERGVPFSVVDGSVLSRSPWFMTPASEVKVLGEPTPVRYAVAIPPAMDVVNHAGLSLSLKVGGDSGPWISTAYAYKPINQLLLAYDGHLQLDEQGREIAFATIFPRVLYHHLNSFETGFRNERFKASLSALLEWPERDLTPASWTTQEIRSALAVSPQLTFNLGGTGTQSSQLELSYLRVWGGNAPDGVSAIGGFSQSSTHAFEPRYPFEEAARLGWKAGRGAFSWTTQIFEDFRNRGTILSGELKYHWTPFWEWALGADIWGLHTSEAEASSSFIGRFQGNDRVHVGVTYVF